MNEVAAEHIGGISTQVYESLARHLDEYLSDQSNDVARNQLATLARQLFEQLMRIIEIDQDWYYGENLLNTAQLLTRIGFKIPIHNYRNAEELEQKDVFKDFSILIPNYNHAKWLVFCLDAIANQTVLPEKVVIADDCSTDNSLDILYAYAARYSWIEVIKNETNFGPLRTTNKLMEQCTTKYMYPGTADDFILPRFVEDCQKGVLQYPQAGIYFGKVLCIDTDNSLKWALGPSAWPVPGFHPPEEFFSECIVREPLNFSLSGATMYRRDALLAEGGFSIELQSWADTYVLRNIGLKHGVYYTGSPGMVWRTVPGQYSSQQASDLKANVEFVETGLKLMKNEKGHSFYDSSYRYSWGVNFLAVHFSTFMKQAVACQATSFVSRLERLYEYEKLVANSDIPSLIGADCMEKLFGLIAPIIKSNDV